MDLHDELGIIAIGSKSALVGLEKNWKIIMKRLGSSTIMRIDVLQTSWRLR
jgi:hypothetical protein